MLVLHLLVLENWISLWRTNILIIRANRHLLAQHMVISCVIGHHIFLDSTTHIFIVWVVILVLHITHRHLLLLLLATSKESIIVALRVSQSRYHYRWIVFWYAAVFDKVFHVSIIISHLRQFVDEILLHHGEMLIGFFSDWAVALIRFLT